MAVLLRPRWLIAHLGVTMLAVGFVLLGLWQIGRHRERVEENQVAEARLAETPLPLGVLVSQVPETNQYRRITATGVFDPVNEVLIRSQVHLGTAGFHVVTPLVGEDDVSVLVNRGWVPLVLDTVPSTQAPPPAGVVTIVGWVQLTETRPRFGRIEPEGRQEVLNRIDVDRIEAQLPYAIADFYLVELKETLKGELPIPLDLPSFDDNGPHLAYAIQWFGFAVIGLIGYYFILRRALRLPGGSPRG